MSVESFDPDMVLPPAELVWDPGHYVTGMTMTGADGQRLILIACRCGTLIISEPEHVPAVWSAHVNIEDITE